MKEYKELTIEILLIYEDVVRCSRVGDDADEDIFE